MNAQFYVNAWKASARSLEWRYNLWQSLKDQSEHVELRTAPNGRTWFRDEGASLVEFTGV